MKLNPLEPGCCPVCMKAECGAGYAPTQNWRSPPVMTCEEDLPLARTVHQMIQKGFLHRVEAESLRAAGAVAGNWLLSHGETDMVKLTPDAWEFFLGTFRAAFAAEMRARLSSVKS